MPAIIRRLPPALLQREELTAKIDEGRVSALAAKLELEQAAVERQRLFDVADLKRDVVETDCARFLCFGHSTLHNFSFMWGADRASAIGSRMRNLLLRELPGSLERRCPRFRA
jgi:hypothetical protein